jgi:hypothetical protein
MLVNIDHPPITGERGREDRKEGYDKWREVEGREREYNN